VALAIDYGVALVRGVGGFHVQAGHFVERHGLIIIIALGESIVAIGAAGLKLDAGIVLATFFAVMLSAALWWAYFDYVVLAAERRLVSAQGRERARLARDSYSYLHLTLVAGIIFVALGFKKTLAHVEDPLEMIPAVALCGGAALYLLGHNAFRLRDTGTVSLARFVVAALSCALIPVAMSAPALVTLAILAVLLAALVAFETVRSREFRDKLRAH
jgi:low temperature requirement protein LtrA